MSNSIPSQILIVIPVTIGIVLGVLLTGYVCERPLGSYVWGEGSPLSAGYVLVSPYYTDLYYDKPGEILLINARGDVVHSWATKYTVLTALLQQDGSVYAAMTPPIDSGDYPSPGTTGLIQHLDWNGNVLWEYEDQQMTHDFEVLPDNKIAYMRWHEASPAFARNVRGGFRTATTSVWTNEIVIVNRDKEIEWTWKPDDHLDPRDFVLGPLVPRYDWAHINSIRYTEHNPLTGTPAFLISARDISTVFIVDAESGDIIWQSPKEMFALQHDATFTESGTILVFDNGLFRNQEKAALWSRVVEVDPKNNEIVWYFDGGKGAAEKTQFASAIMGGAQRLANGNTLITMSMANTLLEVTPEKRIVWRFSDDLRTEEGRMRSMFRAHKYDAKGTAWETRVPKWPGLAMTACST